MNCQDIAQLLDDGELGQLDAGARRKVELHVESCADCAREWHNHMRLVSQTLPTMPAALIARCRGVATAAPLAGRWRARQRHLLVGTIVVVAAAAATLALYFPTQPAQSVVAAVPGPVTKPDSSVPEAAPSPVLEEKPSVTGTRDVAAQPVVLAPATAPFVVQVQPLKNEATDSAASIAIEALFAEFLQELRSVPGVILTGPHASAAQPSENQPGASDRYKLEISGMGPGRDNSVSAALLAERLAADGKVRATTSYQIEGDMASSCTASVIPDLSACTSPVGVAAYLVRFLRLTVFPPDASFSRELQAQLLDRGLAPAQRLSALADLRSFGMRYFSTGADDFTALADPANLRGAVDLAAEATDPAQRAQVWRTFRGAGHAELVAPLLAASQLDPSAQVRVEAVATLAADYGEDTRVRAAFEVLAKEDASPMVRALAQRNLTGEAGWRQYILASLHDDSRPAEERLEAIFFHLNEPPDRLAAGSRATDPRNLLLELLDEEAIPVLAEVLPMARGSASGRRAWTVLVSRMGPIDHPAITDMLLESLGAATDGSEWMVLSQLRQRVGDPRVRAALEKLAAESPDPGVRAAARSALGQ